MKRRDNFSDWFLDWKKHTKIKTIGIFLIHVSFELRSISSIKVLRKYWVQNLSTESMEWEKEREFWEIKISIDKICFKNLMMFCDNFMDKCCTTAMHHDMLVNMIWMNCLYFSIRKINTTMRNIMFGYYKCDMCVDILIASASAISSN